VNCIAWHAVAGRERYDAAILDPAETTFFGCGPYRAIAIEPEARDIAFADSFCRRVTRAHSPVLEKQHPAVLPE
jgi:hypothetical protein